MKLNLRNQISNLMELARELEFLLNRSHFHSPDELDCILREIADTKEKLLLDLKTFRELIKKI